MKNFFDLTCEEQETAVNYATRKIINDIIFEKSLPKVAMSFADKIEECFNQAWESKINLEDYKVECGFKLKNLIDNNPLFFIALKEASFDLAEKTLYREDDDQIVSIRDLQIQYIWD
jgi:hypothetical protein